MNICGFWSKRVGEMAVSFVYIIKAIGSCIEDKGVSYFKVGVSDDPPSRMIGLQTSSYRRLQLLVQIPINADYVYELETLIHKALRDNRSDGSKEWFYGTFALILEGVELGVDTIKDRYGPISM